jgi:integrase
VGLGVRRDADPENGITEAQAFERLAEYRAAYVDPDPRGKTTFSQFWPGFVAHKKLKNRSKTTLTAIDVAIRVHLEPEFGERPMAEITADDFEEWMARELEKASPKSVKNWRGVASSIWKFAVRKGVVTENVVALTEAPYVPRREDVDVMTTADIAAVRDAFPGTPMGRLMDLVVLLASRCGLRESEIIALRWRDIRWEAGWIHVVQGHVRGETKLPKGRRAGRRRCPRSSRSPSTAGT